MAAAMTSPRGGGRGAGDGRMGRTRGGRGGRGSMQARLVITLGYLYYPGAMRTFPQLMNIWIFEWYPDILDPSPSFSGDPRALRCQLKADTVACTLGPCMLVYIKSQYRYISSRWNWAMYCRVSVSLCKICTETKEDYKNKERTLQRETKNLTKRMFKLWCFRGNIWIWYFLFRLVWQNWWLWHA